MQLRGLSLLQVHQHIVQLLGAYNCSAVSPHVPVIRARYARYIIFPTIALLGDGVCTSLSGERYRERERGGGREGEREGGDGGRERERGSGRGGREREGMEREREREREEGSFYVWMG